MERYPLVYADPAMSYRDEGGRGSALRHYETCTPLQVAVEIDRHAAADAVLLMCCFWPVLDECFEAARIAGFKRRTLAFLWVKTAAKGRSLHWGMGHWTRSNTEAVFLFTRGVDHLRPISHSVHQVVFAPARKHSQKPLEIRDRIVDLFGDEPRIELFARERAEGWASMGLELPPLEVHDGSVQMEGVA